MIKILFSIFVWLWLKLDGQYTSLFSNKFAIEIASDAIMSVLKHHSTRWTRSQPEMGRAGDQSVVGTPGTRSRRRADMRADNVECTAIARSL